MYIKQSQTKPVLYVILIFMLNTFLIIVLVVIIFVLLFVIFRKQNTKDNKEQERAFILLQNQLDKLSNVMEDRFARSQSELHQVLRHQDSESKKLITDITRELTEVKESSKQVFSVTEQLQSLEKILTHQKQRGNLGELSLEMILANMLPPGQYEMQYRFSDGLIVDAIIKTKDGMIPIDSKYSLDNYQRLINSELEEDIAYFQNEFKKDIQKRIDETAKYIKPDEGTLPFAFMFIPAEGIYYDLLVNQASKGSVNTQNLIEYAYHKKKVIIVSPTTFYAYLQTVAVGFRALKIEESAKHIEQRVQELGRHMLSYEDYFKKLGNSLSTTVGHYNNAYKELKKVDKDVFRIAGESVGIDPLVIDKPSFSEE